MCANAAGRPDAAFVRVAFQHRAALQNKMLLLKLSALENLPLKKNKLERVTLFYVQGFADQILNGLVGRGGRGAHPKYSLPSN